MQSLCTPRSTELASVWELAELEQVTWSLRASGLPLGRGIEMSTPSAGERVGNGARGV